MNAKQQLGKIGENLASEYLEKQGYLILERNFACRRGEIDIIAKDEKEFVFVEVKTRKSLKFGYPAEAVTNIKRKHMQKAAQYYLYKNKLNGRYVRFDVIEIYWSKHGYRINQIKQIL